MGEEIDFVGPQGRLKARRIALRRPLGWFWIYLLVATGILHRRLSLPYDPCRDVVP